MRIGEVARRAEASASRIRFYEARGLIPRAARAANGYRDYPGSVVETLRLIEAAQQLGFSLVEIRVGLADAGPPSAARVLDALRRKLVGLDAHLHEIATRRRRVVALIRKYEAKSGAARR